MSSLHGERERERERGPSRWDRQRNPAPLPLAAAARRCGDLERPLVARSAGGAQGRRGGPFPHQDHLWAQAGTTPRIVEREASLIIVTLRHFQKERP